MSIGSAADAAAAMARTAITGTSATSMKAAKTAASATPEIGGAGIDAMRAAARTGTSVSDTGTGGLTSAVDGARWYQDGSIYQAHVRSFQDSTGNGIGDFNGLTDRLDHVESMGHDAIWILPYYKSPLKDGGYDISDYMSINPDYGTMADFERFVGEAHKRGIKVINELVLNHTSDQHKWFQDEVEWLARRRAMGITDPPRADETRYVWDFTPKEHGPPERWSDTRVIFQDFEPSNWTWHEKAGAWYWHRFYKEQPDLNWDNPNVVKDMYDVVDFWLDKGVDGIRLDAVPYLFERDGFQGENLRETHEALKALRAHVDGKYQNRMLLAEANMPTKETLEYFGDGDEVHTAFNFPLMPRLYLGTLFGDKRHVIEGLEMTDSIPDGTAWLTFLRNHDEMTLEKVPPAVREKVWDIYRAGRPAEGIEADPRAPINLGVRLRLSDLMGHDKRRIEMMNSMLYSQPGTPIMYYGDEIGMATHRGLNDRDGVRTAMQWNASRNGGFSSADPERLFLPAVDDARYGAEKVNVAVQEGDPDSLLERTRALVRVRAEHPALRTGATEIVDTGNDAVVAYRRFTDDETIVAVTNLTDTPQTTSLDLSRFAGSRVEPIHGSAPGEALDDVPTEITLEPYGYRWLKIEPPNKST